jgi:hypothetical protein
MIKVFKSPDGIIFGCPENTEVTVDEVIEFLEQHRGKKFYNGAAEDTSFRVKDGIISCDTSKFFVEEAYDSYDEELAEDIADFFCE